ncbi:hypothetical protein ACQEVB_09555 [Pseudonocardia sp. CA-107938]|uniref:hypothetical protein n=1 Tax=Pseudonocardia sp. CA-107938 TaxID=3240021 RepID=UPI003D8A6EC3
MRTTTVTSRSSARAAVAGLVAAAALLTWAAPATADPGERPETAFALAGQGLLNFGPLTRVAAPDGKPAHAEAVGLASVPGLAEAGVSGGLLTADARAGYAATSVAELKLAALLSADVVKTSCEDGRGKVEIVNGSLLGTALPQFPVRGQTVDLTIARATFGEEKRNADGTITVTGIRVTVLPAGGPPTRNVGFVTADEPDDSGDSTDTADDTPVAPRPRPRATAPTPRTTSASPAPLVPGPDSLGLPGLPLLTQPSDNRPTQTVTIGSATCDTVQQPVNAVEQDGNPDDADDAPAPTVVQADLPVTR